MTEKTLTAPTDGDTPVAGREASAGDEPSGPVGDHTQAAEVTPVDFDDLGDGVPDGAARDAGLLAGIDVEVSVELGRSKIPMRRLLSLAPGAVVELDRAPNTTVDILVNGTAIARGEVVVVDGDFGVRVTEILKRRP